jgi:hypothetical protein
MHRLVDSAITDRRPAQQWLGPDGGPLLQDTGDEPPKKDTQRENLLLFPRQSTLEFQRYGLLVGVLVPVGTTELLPSKDNPKPAGVMEIGSKNTIRNTTDKVCEIWMAINDAVIVSDPAAKLDEGKKIYVETMRAELVKEESVKIAAMRDGLRKHGLIKDVPSDVDIKAEQAQIEASAKEAAEKRWEYIERNGYWNLWYDDNIGGYEVTCEVE